MRDRNQTTFWLFLLLWSGALTLLVYGAALNLPFFFDDFVYYPFVEANNVVQIWLDTQELPYYRPLNLTIWRLTYIVLQRHDHFVDHAINLLLHMLNGFLVGWLAARLWTRETRQFPVVSRMETTVDWSRAFLSATLFLLFPLSYQATPWVNSMTHLLVTALILLSVTAYVKMRRAQQVLWGVVSLIFALLAPFAHENGVLVMPFIVLVELTTPNAPDRWRHTVQAASIWSLPLLIYAPIWLGLPRVGGGSLLPNNIEGMLQNSAYFFQGGFYPFTQWGGWLLANYGLNDMLLVGLLGLLGVVIAIFVQLTNRATLRSWLPWGWMLLASLPAILFLVFEYVINGPRLLMVASVGAAWLWADVALLLARGGRAGSRQQTLRMGLALALVGLVLWRNFTFIRARMEMHQVLGAGFQTVIDTTVQANKEGETAVVINFPSWLAPQQAEFALGHEGVLFWPDYVPPAVFISVHTGELGELVFVKVDAIRPELENYYYGPTGPSPDWAALTAVPAQVWLTQFDDSAVKLLPVGKTSVPEQQSEPLALFVDELGETAVILHAAQIEETREGLRLDLYWEAVAPPVETTVFIHGLDPSGQLVVQADGEPLGGSLPLNQWPLGKIMQDTRWLPLTATENALQVQVGLYNRLSGARVTAVTPAGELWSEQSVRIVNGERP